jgi:AbrB family looped-hinge helix DNA binding protein
MKVRLQSYLDKSIIMQTTLLSSKGQVIIPKILRVARHWGAGTRLEVQDTPEGILLRHIAPVKKTDLKSGLAAIRLRVAYAGPTLSLADMEAAVLHEASKTRPRPSK